MSLLFFGPIYKDESFFDYLIRLSDKNGFKSVLKFNQYILNLTGQEETFIKNLYPNPQQRALTEIFSRIGVSKNIPPGNIRCKFKYSARYEKKREFEYAFRTLGTKICQRCMEDETYNRFYWKYSSYRVCHKHGNILSIVKEGEFWDPQLEQCCLNKILKYYEGEEDFQFRFNCEVSYYKTDLALIKSVPEFFERFYYIDHGIDLEACNNVIHGGEFIGIPAKERRSILIKLIVNNSLLSFNEVAASLALITLSTRQLKVFKVFNLLEGYEGEVGYSVFCPIWAGRLGIFEEAVELFRSNRTLTLTDADVLNAIFPWKDKLKNVEGEYGLPSIIFGISQNSRDPRNYLQYHRWIAKYERTFL